MSVPMCGRISPPPDVSSRWRCAPPWPQTTNVVGHLTWPQTTNPVGCGASTSSDGKIDRSHRHRKEQSLEVTATAIRELLNQPASSVPVTSVYLNTDGARYPRPADYEARLDNLLRDVRRA